MTDGGRGRRGNSSRHLGSATALATTVILAMIGLMGAAPVTGAAAPKPPSVPASSSGGAVPKALAALPALTAPPSVPFITGVVPEGLGLLVNWNPNPSSDDVTGYTLTASVATGFAAKVSKKCASPAAFAASGADSSALIPKLCAGVPYVVSMSATSTGGTSAASALSDPTVPLVAQPPSAPLITSVFSRSAGFAAPRS